MELALNQHQLKILKFFQEIYLYFELSSSIVIELLERFEHVLKIYQDTSNVSDETRFLS